jgi:hypothetical protein
VRSIVRRVRLGHPGFTHSAPLTRPSRPLAIIAVLVASLLAATSAHARVSRDFVGIASEDVFAGGASYRESNLSAQQALRIGLIRQTFDWSTIETSPGTFNFARYDSFVVAAARHRITVLPILFNAPSFHAQTHSGRGASRPDSKAFARFAAAVARRYGRGGSLWSAHPEVRALPFHSYQFWNEPTLKVYWLPKPNARQYVALLKAGRKAVRAVDRRAEIVTAGLPNSLQRSAVRLLRFLKSMYRVRGVKKSFTTLAINSYAKNSSDLKRLLRKVRRLMRKKHHRAKIWITEIGWATSGPRNRFNVGLRKQAKLIRSSLRFIKRNRRKLRLRGFVYYSWRDAPPYGPAFTDMWGLHTGLLTQGGAQKAGYGAFRSAVRSR